MALLVEPTEKIAHPNKKTNLSLADFGLAPAPKPSLDTGKPFCEQYAAHGFCYLGNKCPRSHDLDIILDHELGTGPVTKKIKLAPDQDYHSACFDAYMTGFVFGHQHLNASTQESRNKIYLIGKQMPLSIEKSHYAKCSQNHTTKFNHQ